MCAAFEFAIIIGDSTERAAPNEWKRENLRVHPVPNVCRFLLFPLFFFLSFLRGFTTARRYLGRPGSNN